jgi:hypothetical protein
VRSDDRDRHADLERRASGAGLIALPVPVIGQRRKSAGDHVQYHPDAPVNEFMLTINAGKLGIPVITGRGRTNCRKA